MIRQIEISSFLKPMGSGVSRPILVMGSDFNSYILKNQRIDNNGNVIDFNCMFLNELLAYQVGNYLGIPMPEAAIACVDKIFIEKDPTIRFAYRYSEGQYFACTEIENIDNNYLANMEELKSMGKKHIIKPWKQFFHNIINVEDIAKILAFDILIGNFDRYTNEGNILVSITDEGRKIFAIDHGHAFWGPMWTTDKINNLNLVSPTNEYIINFIKFIQFKVNNGKLDGLGGVFKALEDNIDLSDLSNHPFIDVVEKIEEISEEYIDEWLNNIPVVWFVDRDKQISYYKKFILGQKNLIRYFIQHLANQQAFGNYAGGELKWKQKNQCGTA